MSCASIVIIGTGLAGYNLAKNVRAQDPNVPITLITQGEGHLYSKPMLSTALCQKKKATDLIISSAHDMATKYNFTVLCHTTVTHISPLEKHITLIQNGNKEILAYEKLILAQGATPKTLPLLPKSEQIFQINQWEEYQNFTEKLPNFKRIAIIGTGLVGCEFAHDLCHLNIEVFLITPETHCLARWVDPEIAAAIHSAYAEKGITILTECHLHAIHAGESVTITHSKGELNVDAVLSAIGLQPNIALAKNAGIETNVGIKVDALCQTNIKDIYAIGDCMEYQGECTQFVAPILHQSQKLAQTLCNNPQALCYSKMPISLKSASYPILHLPAPVGVEGTWEFIEIEAGIVGKFSDQHGQLKGFTLSGKAVAQRMEMLKAVV